MADIVKINNVIRAYFESHISVDKVPAKDLMPQFIEAGIFNADYRNGLPIRKLLRDLDKKNQLHLITSVFADRKVVNTNWYFTRNSSLEKVINTTTVEEKLVISTEINTVQQNGGNHSREDSDEYYVIDLCDKIFGIKGKRQHRFDFLLGDKNEKGNQVKLPVDVYYPTLNCVIEYTENQHTSENKFFDKPDRQTVSGVHRGEQRKIYDQRRREILPKHGIILIEIPYHTFVCDRNDKIIRNPQLDEKTVKKLLSKYFPNLD